MMTSNFARANSARACSDFVALTEFTRLGRRGVGAEGDSIIEKRGTEGDLAKQVTLFAEPTFCFSLRHVL